MIWFMAHSGHSPEALGFLPGFLSDLDEEPAAEQFATNYCGGWDSFKGFEYDPGSHRLTYPGDPPMFPIAMTTLRSERILVYEYGWVLIVQPDGSFDAARLD